MGLTLPWIARWAIRQSLGTKRGDQLLSILALIRPEDIDALLQLIDRIRNRDVRSILSDLTILAAIDDIVRPVGDGDATR